MEGFTYFHPLQTHFVRGCLEKGTRVAFVHPHDPTQPDALAVMARTYAASEPQAARGEVVTDFDSAGHDLRLLQRGLFAAAAPSAPRGDGSVTVTTYPHRHREVAECLERIRAHLDAGTRAGDVAVVMRNAGEFLPVLREEARRLGLHDRVQIEPRLLLLTQLGRFALTLYDLAPGGALDVRAEQFETMIASGWLGAAVQQTAESFAAARAQVFERCRRPEEWAAAFAVLDAAGRTDPGLARLPGTAVRPAHVGLWRRAFGQVAELHGRLFDGRPRSVAEHVRRLRDRPRPAAMPWPFFSLDPDADAERERYLFLAVVRAVRRELHLSYARQGDDEVYSPWPYLARAAQLPARADDLKPPAGPTAAAAAAAVPLPVLPGRTDELPLLDVAAFGLCPYRFRLERADPAARRHRAAAREQLGDAYVGTIHGFCRLFLPEPDREAAGRAGERADVHSADTVASCLWYGRREGHELTDRFERQYPELAAHFRARRAAVKTDTVPELLGGLYERLGLRRLHVEAGDPGGAEGLERLCEVARSLTDSEQALTVGAFARPLREPAAGCRAYAGRGRLTRLDSRPGGDGQPAPFVPAGAAGVGSGSIFWM